MEDRVAVFVVGLDREGEDRDLGVGFTLLLGGEEVELIFSLASFQQIIFLKIYVCKLQIN